MSGRLTIIRRSYKRRMEAGEIINCALCGVAIPRRATGSLRIKKGGRGGLSLDHIIPRVAGGSNRVENIQPTHLKCNNAKGEKYPHLETYYDEKLGKVAQKEVVK